MPAVMGWSVLGTQFCLELGFGVLLAMVLVARAPMGPFFFRLMGTTAVLPVLMAAVLPPLSGDASWTEPFVLAAAVAVLAYPVYSGPVKARRRLAALSVATVACGLSLALVVRSAAQVDGGLPLAVASLSALATGAVAGGVGLAMVVGHWYLTIPGLAVAHLRRLNRFTMACMAVSLLAVGATCAVAAWLSEGDTPLLGRWGLFSLGTRVAVGLVLPLVFAWMASESLKLENTRSATGILYASTVLVLIGTAVSISLQDSYGLPL
jgi:hypothetical protein